MASNPLSKNAYLFQDPTVGYKYLTGSFTEITVMDVNNGVPGEALHNTGSISNVVFGEYKPTSSSKGDAVNFKVHTEVTSSIIIPAGTTIKGTPHILSFTVDFGSNSLLTYTDGQYIISSSGDSVGSET